MLGIGTEALLPIREALLVLMRGYVGVTVGKGRLGENSRDVLRKVVQGGVMLAIGRQGRESQYGGLETRNCDLG